MPQLNFYWEKDEKRNKEVAEMKNILFLCKYNRFRSKVAEDYFNRINKNPKLKAKSAGIIEGSPIDLTQKKISKKLGIELKGKPKGVSTKLLKWQDIIVIVANDVPPALFKDNKKYGKKLIVWKIPDAKEDNESEIKRIVNSIKINVNNLVKGLK